MYLDKLADYDALVLGGGLGGLCAAWSLQRQGARVAVLEERGRAGGLLCSGYFNDFKFDIGAEAFVSSADAVRKLAEQLGLELVNPAGRSFLWTQLADSQLGKVPIPAGFLGIPAHYQDPAAQLALTGAEYRRFLADQDLPPEVGSTEETLAGLVTARLGAAVLDKLVEPVAGGIHSCSTRQLHVETVCPGLRPALAKTGSLLGAVGLLRGKSGGWAAVCAPKGGMFKLVEALGQQIVAGGGAIFSHTRALSLASGREGRFRVLVSATKSAASPGLSPLNVGAPLWVESPQVVVALPGQQAKDLLNQLPGFQIGALPQGGPIQHVTLLVQEAALDLHPVGSGILVKAPAGDDTDNGKGTWPVQAKALTHYTAKWAWASQETQKAYGPGTHLLRVSYGRAGEPSPQVPVDQALRDASVLLGTDLTAEKLLGSKIVHWDGSLPPFTAEHRQVTKSILQRLATIPGLDLVGSWVAGSGISAVVPQALAVKMRSLGQQRTDGVSPVKQPLDSEKSGLRLGTRASLLAVTQSQLVAEALSARGLPTHLQRIRTAGDVSRLSLKSLGGVGVFAAQLRAALLAGSCDLAVHSYKDLPAAPVARLVVAAVPKRQDLRDCLCAAPGMTLQKLPPGAKVGTGSTRRAAQLLHLRPDLQIVDIRGNVPTRLGRIHGVVPPPTDSTGLHQERPRGDLDAVVLAAAGLKRLGLTSYITQYFDPQVLLPAGAQGALAVEVNRQLLQESPPVYQLIASLNDPVSALAVRSERALLQFLQAGCAAPLGVWGQVSGQYLRLTAGVFAPDGSRRLVLSDRVDLGDAWQDKPDADALAQELGSALGTQLLAQGAAEIADLSASKPPSLR